MKPTAQTGNWKDSDSLLALYHFYVNASDGELVDARITRDHLLGLIRTLEADMDRYRETELLTIALQLLRAFNAGRS